MVLASAREMTLEALVQLADKVMEVSSQSISSVSATPQNAEVENCRKKWNIYTASSQRYKSPAVPATALTPVRPVLI